MDSARDGKSSPQSAGLQSVPKTKMGPSSGGSGAYIQKQKVGVLEENL